MVHLGRVIFALWAAARAEDDRWPLCASTTARGSGPFGDKPSPPVVCIVTQSSRGRTWNLERICDRWRGPISAAVYVQKGPLAAAEAEAEAATRSCAGAVVAAVGAAAKGEQYPVNRLRNVAWENVPRATTHIWVLDVDFWPSADSRHAIAAAAAGNLGAALVVPAFEMDWRYRRPPTRTALARAMPRAIPRTVAELAACLRRAPTDKPVTHKIAKMVHSARHTVPTEYVPDEFFESEAALWHSGANHALCQAFHHHGSTRFARWLVDSAIETPGPASRRIDCFMGDFFEPFVVVPVCAPAGGAPPAAAAPPRFDEAFDGYGKNKLEWIAGLRARNYTFATVRGAFIVHGKHSDSRAKAAWGVSVAKGGHRATVDAAFQTKLARYDDARSASLRLAAPYCDAIDADWRLQLAFDAHPWASRVLKTAAAACDHGDDAACAAEGRRERALWASLGGAPDPASIAPAAWNDRVSTGAALRVPAGFKSDAVRSTMLATVNGAFAESPHYPPRKLQLRPPGTPPHDQEVTQKETFFYP